MVDLGLKGLREVHFGIFLRAKPKGHMIIPSGFADLGPYSHTSYDIL